MPKIPERDASSKAPLTINHLSLKDKVRYYQIRTSETERQSNLKALTTSIEQFEKSMTVNPLFLAKWNVHVFGSEYNPEDSSYEMEC